MGKIVLIIILAIGICFLLFHIISLFSTKKSFRGKNPQALLLDFNAKYYSPKMKPEEFINKLRAIIQQPTIYAPDDIQIAQELLDFHEEEQLIKKYLSKAKTKLEWRILLNEISENKENLYTTEERLRARVLLAKIGSK